ncbi:MAG: homoserine kinase [Anaerolineaceae bacterium]|nr:homoserine kinase [Anaerolineaceae bacterium]
MQRVKIKLPATVTNLGPGLGSLGLAVGLYMTIEINGRDDNNLVVETEGEGAGRYGTGLRHPVTLGMMRVFQQQERATLGIHVRVHNDIPFASGLGAETAFHAAGIIAANNLLGNPYSRQEILNLTAQISGEPDHALPAVLGGLTTCMVKDDLLTYRTLTTTPFTIVVVVPELADYKDNTASIIPERVALHDALHNLGRLPLLLEAFKSGSLELLAEVMDDQLYTPHLKARIPGYDHVLEMAQRAGAVALTLSGTGPALLAFAPDKHEKIATAMTFAFEQAGVTARSWVLPVDTQGVQVSVARSA